MILLCDGASCWLNGADAVRDALMARLGIGYGETTADGKYTLINVACVGGCDRAPAAVIGRDRRLVGPLTPEGCRAMLEARAMTDLPLTGRARPDRSPHTPGGMARAWRL